MEDAASHLVVAEDKRLAFEEADRFAEATNVACSFFAFAYKVGVKHLSYSQSALTFTRQQLDRLQIGADLQRPPWGSKTFKFPPSQFKA